MTDISDTLEDDDCITVGVLWTTNNMAQPLVSITVKTEMVDSEREMILMQIGEFIDTNRKRKKETAEITVGRNCEDHVTVLANEMWFAKPSKGNVVAPPTFVKWLRKTLPLAGIIPVERLRFAVQWLDHRTRALHPQP